MGITPITDGQLDRNISIASERSAHGRVSQIGNTKFSRKNANNAIKHNWTKVSKGTGLKTDEGTSSSQNEKILGDSIYSRDAKLLKMALYHDKSDSFGVMALLKKYGATE